MTINFTASKGTWDNHVFTNFSKTLTRTPVTRSLDNISGSETYTEGTSDTDYKGILYRKESEWAQQNPGLIEDADAVLLIKTSQTLNKDDKITYESEDFRVIKVTMRRFGEVEMYQVAQMVII